jgi:signal peptidase II
MKLKYRILLIGFLCLLTLDQGSKYYIVHHVPLHHSHEIIAGILNVTYVENRGAAFGLMANQHHAFFLFIVTSCVAIGCILFYFRRLGARDLIPSIALSLVLAGAVGNLIDRIRLGAVIDFLDLHYKHWHWPAFNVADAAITLGIVLLGVSMLWGGRKVVSETK